MGSGPCSEGSRSNGNSAPVASSPSKRSAASTARRRSACSRRSVVLSSVVTQVGLPVRAPLPAGARGVAGTANPAMKGGEPEPREEFRALVPHIWVQPLEIAHTAVLAAELSDYPL